MEALEELAVSYERQDGEMEASNEEKAALQCEIEKMQVGSHVTHTLFNHLLNRVSTKLGLRYLYTGSIYILYSLFHNVAFYNFHSPFHSMSCRREHSSFWPFRKLATYGSGLLPTWYRHW